MPAQGYRDKRLPLVLARTIPKGFPSALATVTRRKLAMLDAAQTLADLREPPANHLEALQGDRAGQHSIRINKQFRLCFRWTSRGPDDVELVDYHRGS
jgi:toxin HigB-1